jgi:hypothetical protein
MFSLSAVKVIRYSAMYGFITYFEMIFIGVSARAHLYFLHLNYSGRNMSSQSLPIQDEHGGGNDF